MHKTSSLLLVAAVLMLGSASLQSCCEPASKDAHPFVVDSLFSRSTAWDIDLAKNATKPAGSAPDSGYYPIYTFGITNTGSQDDIFTLRVRSQYTLTSGTPLGFDISRTVPAHSTVLFRTPTAVVDSITSQEKITYTAQDTLPLMSRAYLGFFESTPDSTMLQFENPHISILYGGIDNGPEGCSTPPAEMQVDLVPFYNR